MSVAARTAGALGRWMPRAVPGPFSAPINVSNTGRPPTTFGPDAPLKFSVQIALGADPDADPSTWVWEDITSFVRFDPGISVTTGRADEFNKVTPGRGDLVIDNRDGRFSRRNTFGPYYGQLSRNTPIQILVDAGSNAYPVMCQYVNEWPARWDKTATDFTVQIKTGGILRRLGQSGQALSSALRRTIGAYFTSSLVAYWPMEDGTNSDTFGSALSDGSPMSIYGTTISPGSSGYANGGTDPVAIISTGASGFASGGVTTYTSPSTNAWTIGALFYFSAIPDGTNALKPLEWHCSGTLNKWQMYWDDATDGLIVKAFDKDGTAAFTTNVETRTNAQITNRWIVFYAGAQQNGTSVDYFAGYDSLDDDPTYSENQASSTSIASHTLGNIVSVKVSNGAASDDVAVGHVWVLDEYWGIGQNALTYDALNGHLAERCDTRIQRLCDEEGVTVTIQPRITLSENMGKQGSDTFLNLLRECELADGGVLYEDGFGLGYQPLSTRYNLAPAMVLDFAQKHIGEEPQPTDDDQSLRNSVTITRADGGSALFEDQDSIDLDGTYSSSETVSLWKNFQCDQVAAWRVHMGTIEEHRWPLLSLNLASTAGRTLIQQWIDLPFGSRLTVANPPYQISSDLIDVYVEGKTEMLTQFTWTVQMNCAPASPFSSIFTLEDAVYGRLDTDNSTLSTGNTQAPSLGDAATKDYILLSDADALNFAVDNICKLYTYTGRDKDQALTFTVTSKVITGFGFTEVHYSPNSTDLTLGVLTGIGSDYIKLVDETSLVVATTGTSVWTTDAADFPFDINIDGERMTVATISSATSPQTFTVTRGVNGVRKYHAAGAKVSLWHAPVLAL